MIHATTRFRTTSSLFIIFLAALSVFPHTTRAHEVASDLSATIKTELLSDPRTSGFSEDQIHAMVDILVEQAKKDELTSGDITWRPQDADTFAANGSTDGTIPVAANVCGSSGFLCLLSEAFGFVGSDATIPFILGAASMGLVWIFAEMLHRRRVIPEVGVSSLKIDDLG